MGYSFDELNMSDREYNLQTDEALRNKLDEVNDNLLEVQSSIESLHKSFKKEHTKKDSGIKIVNEKGITDATMIVKEYNSSYIGDISLATDIHNAQQLGMKLRQLEIELRGGSVAFESGTFLDSSGDIKIGKMSVSFKEMFRGTIRKLNEETFFRPIASGVGKITLDSSFKFIKLLEVPQKTRIVLEKGLYLASIGQFEFATTKNLNPSFMMFSDKGVFQNDVRGVGIIALELPVHESELVEHQVTPDTPYMVNGDYVLMWSGNLKRSVKPMQSIFSSVASGTGLVETYTGTGTVWTAPTLGYYKSVAKDLHNTGFGEERTEDLESNTNNGKRKTTFLQSLFLKD